MDGTAKTASNIDPKWIGYPVVERLIKVTGRPISIINDADAAGIAEMRFGQGRGRMGTVVFLTLGTGVGSAIFIDGKLVPNVEFGTMEIRGKPAEWRSASAARTRRGLGWKAWALDLDEHLDRIDKLVWPTVMILGGGVSKNGDKFIPRLTVRCPIVAADLRNDAGIIGAAIVAAEGRHVGRSRVGAVEAPIAALVSAVDRDLDTTPDAAAETAADPSPGALDSDPGS